MNEKTQIRQGSHKSHGYFKVISNQVVGKKFQKPLSILPTLTINNSIKKVSMLDLRRQLLDDLKKKQPFRVSIGKSKWINYEKFNSMFNLREILKDEIVIEFDHDDRNLTWKATNETCINLYNAGYTFEIWEHDGKSPHIHIRNLPISHLEKDELRLFKKIFIRKYVPKEYLFCVDLTLTGVHLIALEWADHWKGKYSIKKLLFKYNPKEDSQK